MKLIGITGGIGAGKTLVCKIFESMGIPVFNSDMQAKQLMNTSNDLKIKITSLLGPKSYSTGKLNRDYVAKAVFSDKEKLNALNKLVHPVVREEFKLWVKKCQDTPYVINEAALLIESGSYKELDAIIYVNAPEKLRINRVVDRDQCRESDVRSRIENQLSDKEKIIHCKWVINNDNSEMLLPQVMKVHKEIKSL